MSCDSSCPPDGEDLVCTVVQSTLIVYGTFSPTRRPAIARDPAIDYLQPSAQATLSVPIVEPALRYTSQSLVPVATVPLPGVPEDEGAVVSAVQYQAASPSVEGHRTVIACGRTVGRRKEPLRRIERLVEQAETCT